MAHTGWPYLWRGYSDLNACITSTRAARAAGNTEATTATAINTNAETTTGTGSGLLKSKKTYRRAARV